ncbi:hypothetical protein C8F01DRAFT_1368951 [Mycena amicta]|nr:hypothetical protein C8F01DRAFT_1368951 [Mycena amicta]
MNATRDNRNSVLTSTQGHSTTSKTKTTRTTITPIEFLTFADLQRVPEPYFSDYVRSYLPGASTNTNADSEPVVERSERDTVVLSGRIVVAAKGRQRTQGVDGEAGGGEGEGTVPVLFEHAARLVVTVHEDAEDEDEEEQEQERELQFRYRLPHEYVKPEVYGKFPGECVPAPEDEYSEAEEDLEVGLGFAKGKGKGRPWAEEPSPSPTEFIFPPPPPHQLQQNTDAAYLAHTLASLRAETHRANRAVLEAETALKNALYAFESTKAELAAEKEVWEEFWDAVARVAGRDEVVGIKDKVGARVRGEVPRDEMPVVVSLNNNGDLPDGVKWTAKPRPQPAFIPPSSSSSPPAPGPIRTSRFRRPSGSGGFPWSPFLRQQTTVDSDADADADCSESAGDGSGMQEVRALVARRKAKRSRPMASKKTGPLARALGISLSRSGKGSSSNSRREPEGRRRTTMNAAGRLSRILHPTST